jgi:hypothetical protein
MYCSFCYGNGNLTTFWAHVRASREDTGNAYPKLQLVLVKAFSHLCLPGLLALHPSGS